MQIRRLAYVSGFLAALAVVGFGLVGHPQKSEAAYIQTMSCDEFSCTVVWMSDDLGCLYCHGQFCAAGPNDGMAGTRICVETYFFASGPGQFPHICQMYGGACGLYVI